MRKLLLSIYIFIFLVFNYTSPAFSVSCSADGSQDYNADILGFDACSSGEIKRLGSFLTADTCSDAAEVEWNDSDGYLEYCNGSVKVPLKCGLAVEPCTVKGSQRYDTSTDSLQMCDGSNWYNMHTADCISQINNISWVVIGGNNQLLVSEDGVNYLQVDLDKDYTFFNDIAWGLGRWVAVSGNGNVITSIDGKSWSGVDISNLSWGGDTLVDIEYADGLWMMRQGAGSSGRVATSADGVNWSAVTAVNPGYSQGLLKTKNYWISGSSGGDIYYSNDNGASWVENSLDGESGDVKSLTYADGTLLIEKADAFALSELNIATPNSKIAIGGLGTGAILAGGKFVAGLDSSGYINSSSSTDISELADNWNSTQAPGVGYNDFVKLGFGNGEYVLITEQGGLSYSNDLESFSNIKTPVSGSLLKVYYGGLHNDPGNFAFADQVDVSLSEVIESDAITIDVAMTSTQKVYAGNGAEVQVNGGSWVAGDGTATVTGGDTLKVRHTSIFNKETEKVSTIQLGAHTTHWSTTTEEFVVSWVQGLDNAKLQIANALIDRLYDVDVSDIVSDTAVSIESVAYGAGLWVAVGSEETILKSEDGFEWEAVDVPSGLELHNLQKVHYSDDSGVWYIGGRDTLTNNNNVTAFNSDLTVSEDLGVVSTYGIRTIVTAHGKVYIGTGNASHVGVDTATLSNINLTTPTGYSNYQYLSYLDGNWYGAYDSQGNDYDRGEGRDAATVSWDTFSLDDYDGYKYGSIVGGGKILFPYQRSERLVYLEGGASTVQNVRASSDFVYDGSAFGNGKWVINSYSKGYRVWDDDLTTITSANASEGTNGAAYGGLHNDPGNFAFADQVGVSLSEVIESDAITIDVAMTSTQKVYAGNGAEVQVNGGSWVAGDGTATVTGGDTLKVRHTSSFGSEKEKVSTIQVGTHVTHWTTITEEFVVAWAAAGNVDLLLSEDGKIWHEAPNPADMTQVNHIEYGDGKWVAAGQDADDNGIIAYSDDAMGWTVADVSSTRTGPAASVRYSNGKWVGRILDASNEADTIISDDGMTWVMSTTQPNSYTTSYSYAKGAWVASGFNIYKSTDDGDNWSLVESAGGDISGNVAGNGRWFVLASRDNTEAYYYSDDTGDTWTNFDPSTADVNRKQYSLIFAQDNFYYSDQDGAVWEGFDVSTPFTSVDAGTIISKITFGNGLWVVSKYNKGVYFSEDDDFINTLTSAYNNGLAMGSIEYGGSHNDPGNFAFADQVGVSLSEVIESDAITIDVAMTSTQKVYAGNGAEVQVNGGSWVAGDGTAMVTGGDTLKVRHTSATGSGEEKVSTIQVGTHVTHWTTETL